jgi:hypothetical protein
MTNPVFHFPALFLVPGFEDPAVEAGEFRIVRRLWQTSLFDLATLYTRHKLHLAYQVMEVFLHRCNLEIAVPGVTSLADACAKLNHLRLALYSEGVSPFLAPFATNYSINDYSGINSRDSEQLAKQLPEGIRHGLTSEVGMVEAWPVELSLQIMTIQAGMTVTRQAFEAAGDKAKLWGTVYASQPSARTFGQAILSAPLIPIRSQSILHLWCAIESLFPNVSTESTFRYALYLTELSADRADRRRYFDRVKKAYNVRSKIAHGAKQEATADEWQEVWGFDLDAYSAILARGKLPTEEELLDGLLTKNGDILPNDTYIKPSK